MPRFFDAAATLTALRQFLLALLVIGMAATVTELLLIDHREDTAQSIPILLLTAGLLAVLWHLARRTRGSVLILQLTMLLMIAGGLLGFYFHVTANVEFQREIDPALEGGKLWMKVLEAKSPPPLSPGVMMQLGLLGLVYSYRHPASARRIDRPEENWDEV